MIFLRIISSLFLLVSFSALSTQCQNDTTEIISIDNTCEENIVSVEKVMRSAAQEHAKIFIISHRARGERKGVDWARLKYTRMAISQFRQFPLDRIIIAIGEVTEESNGKLNFWVGGKLVLISYIKKNRQVCFHI